MSISSEDLKSILQRRNFSILDIENEGEESNRLPQII